MNDHHIIEVLNSRTLNKYRLADVHILSFGASDDLAALEAADVSGGVYDGARLDDINRHEKFSSSVRNFYAIILHDIFKRR